MQAFAKLGEILYNSRGRWIMFQLSIITVGSIKEDYLEKALLEYKKRLLAFAKIDEISIKEERIMNEDNLAEVFGALGREGDKILSAIPSGASVVALCVEGKQYDSVELASILGKEIDKSGKLCFIIGSSHGLADKVKQRADIKLSASKLTFPHQLMRVMLYEILYRSCAIRAGKKYHK